MLIASRKDQVMIEVFLELWVVDLPRRNDNAIKRDSLNGTNGISEI